MIYDPETSEFVNVPGVLAQLGLSGVTSGQTALLTLIADLTARVSSLESALASAQARIAALEPQVLVPSVTVTTVDGVGLLDYVEVPARDWQPVVLESPEEGKMYRLQPIRDDAGNPNFDLVQADTLTATDGRRWRLTVQLVDGVPNLQPPELLT